MKNPKWARTLQKSKVVFGEIPGGISDVVFYAIDAKGYIDKVIDGTANVYDTGKFATVTISFGVSSGITIATAAGALSNPIALGTTLAILVAERMVISFLEAADFMEGVMPDEIFELGIRNFFGIDVCINC